MASTVHIGTSGYSYAHWRRIVYPTGLPVRAWLRWYATHFDCIELNTTFYRLARPGAAAAWAASVPSNFRFAVKGSRFLTHMKRLRDLTVGPRRFFDSILGLGRKRGPILWQLPPDMKRDVPRLDAFLSVLPPGKHAVEFRNAEWLHPTVYNVLEEHGAALVMHDLLDVKWPSPLPGAFVYRRFHGPSSAYSGDYSKAQLSAVARWLERQKREAWVFFNNDLGGHAFHNARQLKAMIFGRSETAQEPPAAWT